MTDHLFVYGTLLPGEERWPHLQPYVEGVGARDTVRGTLYDTGAGYPAFVANGGPDDETDGPEVHGMTFRLAAARLDEALEVLDAIEGAVRGLYRRITVVTGGGADAYVYEYGGGLELSVIAGGNWLTR